MEQNDSQSEIVELSNAFEFKFDLNGNTNNVDGRAADRRIAHSVNENSNVDIALQKAISNVKEFVDSILALNLNQKSTDSILKSSQSLVNTVNELNFQLLEEGGRTEFCLDSSTELLCNELSSYDTYYKRSTEISENPFYVAPKELAIGTRFEQIKTKSCSGEITKIPQQIQNTFQFISIVETLVSLCKHKEFVDCYLTKNTVLDHKCQVGHYKHFCCGSTYKNSAFFQQNPLAFQIHLAADEFEICNPLSSRANTHKICAIYFVIRNMPTKYLSKLDNIYPVVICNADDLKSKTTDFNNLWDPIVRDLKFLEKVGIKFDDGTMMKGTLTHLSFDNLGANQALGFVSCFIASHFCRFCLCSRDECQLMTTENPTKIRTKESYASQLKTVENSEKVKYDETKGVKYYCKLSELDFFHIIDNPTVDPMHDIGEGCIPFTLKMLFEYAFHHKIFSEDELNYLVQFHNYGWLSRHKKPSKIMLDKRSLGQTASQSMCLFKNLPFIIWKYREHPKLKLVWRCVTSLLRVIELVESLETSDSQLKIMRIEIRIHLEEVKRCFKELFKPKQHFVEHYPTISTIIGPVDHISMMRFEAKHQQLKQIVNKTKNFIDINKTIAISHQQSLCLKGFTYKDHTETSLRRVISLELFSKHQNLFENFRYTQKNIFEIKYFHFNNYVYRHGLIFIHNSNLFLIETLFSVEKEILLLAQKMDLVGFDDFSNCIKVKEAPSQEVHLIRFEEIENKKTYDKFLAENVIYVIGATVDLNKTNFWT